MRQLVMVPRNERTDLTDVMTFDAHARGCRMIRHAANGEAHDVAGLLAEAAAWTGKLGHRIWSAAEIEPDRLERAAAERALVVGVEDGTIVACMQIYDSDPVHWPHESKPALYLHKVAIRRVARGRGWLNELIAWAASEARRRNIEFLRLDTLPGGRLPALYSALGFTAVDPAPVEIAGRTLIRMEQHLGSF